MEKDEKLECLVAVGISFILLTILLQIVHLMDPNRLQEFDLKAEKVTGIEAIFMHQPGKYSLMVPDGRKGKLVLETYRFSKGETKFVPDVKPEEKEWLTYTSYLIKGVSNPDRSLKDPIFHIHAPTSIQGGKWSHGKFGSGETVPLQ